MTDKVQLIKEEIERRIKEGSSKNDISEDALALDSLLDFIDSLPEEHNEDLEEAAKSKYKLITTPPMPAEYAAYYNAGQVSRQEAFKAGAEWQKQKDQETIELAEDHAMLAGMMKEREEMMKALVGGEVVKNLNNQLCVNSEPIKDTFGDLKFGDKVKIIIVKEN